MKNIKYHVTACISAKKVLLSLLLGFFSILRSVNRLLWLWKAITNTHTWCCACMLRNLACAFVTGNLNTWKRAAENVVQNNVQKQNWKFVLGLGSANKIRKNWSRIKYIYEINLFRLQQALSFPDGLYILRPCVWTGVNRCKN